KGPSAREQEKTRLSATARSQSVVALRRHLRGAVCEALPGSVAGMSTKRHPFALVFSPLRMAEPDSNARRAAQKPKMRKPLTMTDPKEQQLRTLPTSTK